MKRACFVLPLLVLVSATLHGWTIRGHSRVAREAALAQPEEVPAFFRWGADAIGHSAVDPDVLKERETPTIRHQEYPEHFLDYELVEGLGLPDERYEFVTRIVNASLDPSRVAVRAEFAASFGLVDRVYELEPSLEALYEEGVWEHELERFATARFRRAVDFLGSLFLTAWRSSEGVSLSGWLERVGPGGEVVRCPGAAEVQ